MLRLASALTLGSLARVGRADVAAAPDAIFGPDRYPTGAEDCTWLNWIADKTGQDDLELVKEDIIDRTMSIGIDRWVEMGNGVLDQHFFDMLAKAIRGMDCDRDATLVENCVGLSDVGCQFKAHAAKDRSTVFHKSDGGIACPSSHQMIEENDVVRVLNVYTPPGHREHAFHTHTRLSFWISYGVNRGETYWKFDGSVAFDTPIWDGSTASELRVSWNGPEWFHMTMMKETKPYLEGQAPGNCPLELAPLNCTNGFKYRVELKLGAQPEAETAAPPPRPRLLRGFPPAPR